ncbi:hypothetical protein SNE40_008688 [Patella caerulea]|uniref:WxxW domain-containing protein n=1 Tax=Patella caerulea TaxID=87958 RepID=A0AAN8JV33_PATCE
MKVFVIVVLALVAYSPSAEAGIHCPCCNKWTPYFNRDKPTGLGDFELLSLHRKENPGQICAAPEIVSCERLTGLFRDSVSIAADYGLACFNFLQSDGQCEDYKCRYCCNYRYPSCPSGYRWTRYYNRDLPTGTGDYETLSLINKENPYARVCTDPIAIDVRVTRTNRPFQTSGENVCLAPNLGFSCVDAQQPDKQCQDYKIRFCCPNNH